MFPFSAFRNRQRRMKQFWTAVCIVGEKLGFVVVSTRLFVEKFEQLQSCYEEKLCRTVDGWAQVATKGVASCDKPGVEACTR